MFPAESSLNPFIAPVQSPSLPTVAVDNHQQPLVKLFHRWSLILGSIWTAFSVLLLAASLIVLLLGQQSMDDQTRFLTCGMTAMLTVAWSVAGIGTLLRKSWGIHTGTSLSMVTLSGCVVSMNIAGIIFYATIFYFAFRLKVAMKQMQAAGIPLSARS